MEYLTTFRENNSKKIQISKLKVNLFTENIFLSLKISSLKK